MNNDRLPFVLCTVGVRKAGDDLELVVFAKDKELLSLPLKKMETAQSVPVALNVKHEKGDAAVLTLRLLGKFQATMPIALSGP